MTGLPRTPAAIKSTRLPQFVNARRPQTTDLNILNFAWNYAPLRHNKPNRASASSENLLQNAEGLAKRSRKSAPKRTKSASIGPVFSAQLPVLQSLTEGRRHTTPLSHQPHFNRHLPFSRSRANKRTQIDPFRGP